MAKFYPTQPPPGTPQSELVTWRALAQLPNSWRVFHSVAWQVPKATRVFDGEADFVLLHPKHGFIVLEVKGGTVWVEDGTWFQQSRNGETHRLAHSPFDQAKGAMYDLGTYFERTIRGATGIPSSYAVVYPAASHPGSMGPGAPAVQIISIDELPSMANAIERLIDYAKLDAEITPEVVNAITGRLAPTRKLTVLLGSSIERANREIIELTDRQVRLLDFLRRQRRALIAGVAGTGKTTLAIEKARRLADEGLNVLLLCFNRPLAEHMSASIERDDIAVGSFHQFALGMVRQAGFVPAVEPSQEWWDTELPDLLPQASERLRETFDALVIDEGQDFRPNWFTALQLLLADPDISPFYVFYDENQTIYLDGWEPPFDAEPFYLDTNCRNTQPIADRVASVIGVEPTSLGADGPKPVWIEADDFETTKTKLAEVLEGLINQQRVDPSQIVVLTDHRDRADDLRGTKIGGTPLHQLGAKSGSIVETIHRFKGLESDVIILLLTKIDHERDRALAYIGMSRARALLVVIGPGSTKRDLSWD